MTPGASQYVLGSPLFDKVTMRLQNGNIFTIKADNNTKDNHYIQSVALNETDYNNTWIDYTEIQKGGHLDFEMDAKPNKDFGVSNSSRPFSLTKNN